MGSLPPEIFQVVLTALQIQLPRLNLRSAMVMPTSEDSHPLHNRANRFDHVVITNRRYLAAEHAKSPYDSFVLVRTHTIPGVMTWAGELREIFVIDQPRVGVHHYGFVRWFVPVEPSILSDTVWAQL